MVGWRFIVAGILVLVASAVAEARSPRIGDAMAPFTLRNLAGQAVDSGQQRGKAVVIYFWTDACGCKEQLVELRRYVAGLKDRQAAFLAVNVGQDMGKVQRFVAENRLPYEVLLDDKARIAREQFGVKVLPTILVISRDGLLREKLIGVVETKKLQSLIGRYL